jgi:hypothetical protein
MRKPFGFFAPIDDPRPASARAVAGTVVAHHQFLDEALGAYTGPDKFSSLANAIAIWAVRKMGGERASTFADAIVGAVQIERRGMK